MQKTTVAVGNDKEAVACEFLENKGLRPLQRNYRLRTGEIDLIMQDGDTIVFIEVRYRKHQHYGGALQSIDFRKQQRLIRTAQHYLMKHAPYASGRFDVIAIEGNTGINWVQNAFEAG